MNEQLISHHKIVQDAEIMTKGEFIQEHGEQYLEYYEQVQANVPSHLSKFIEECSNINVEELLFGADE